MNPPSSKAARLEAKKLRSAGYMALQLGNRSQAMALFEQAVAYNSSDEYTWIWMAEAAESNEQRYHALSRALFVNPYNNNVKRQLASLASTIDVAALANPFVPAGGGYFVPSSHGWGNFEEHYKKAKLFLGLGGIGVILGLLLIFITERVSSLSLVFIGMGAIGLVFLFAGYIFYLIGCRYYAASKGYPPLVGSLLAFFLSFLGIIVLFFLPRGEK